MGRFLLKIFLFILPIWIVLLGVDYSYSYRIAQANASFSKPFYDVYLSADSNYDVLVCGNSRASLQYDPNIIDSILDCNSYNLGFDGSPINLQLVKYDYWLKEHAHPNLCIYNIDLWTMKAEYGKNREQLFPYFVIDRSLMRAFDEYQNYTFTEKYIPFRRYIGHRKLISGVLKGNLSFSKGYYGHDWSWQFLNRRDNQDLYKCAYDSAMIVTFGDFIAREQEHGVKFLFVYAPMFHTITMNNPDIPKMYAMYSDIASQFDIPILDYNYDLLCQDSAYFFNKMHLNKAGAEIFTTKLAHDIDSLGLLK